jgi:hypothetical protein
MSDPVTLTLRKPIQAHGETVLVLTFREPTGKDLAACGMPGGDSMASPEFGGYVRMMISRLAEIPPSSVDTMSAVDWRDAMIKVMLFLGDPTTSEPQSTSISTSEPPSAP